LRQVGDLAGQYSGPQAMHGPPLQHHTATARPVQPGDRAQQGRLPGAVRPDQAEHPPGRHRPPHPVADPRTPGPPPQPAHHDHEILRRDHNTNSRKTGAPTTAVTTPVCKVTDAGNSRAAVSADTRNTAPSSALAGSSSRWSGPVISRTTCGATSPTKP